MKKLIYLLSIILLMSCDNGFEDLNKNPESVTSDSYNYKYLFTTAQLRTSTCGDNGFDNCRTNLYHCELFVQHFASLINTNGSWQGDKYFYNATDNSALWVRTYGYSVAHSNAAKLIVDVIENIKDKAEYHNLYQMARVWKVYIFHRLTDLYGDIPYSQACRGYYDQIFTPKYDAQRDIYLDMLNELSQAATLFDATKDNVGTTDIVYKGELSKWKTFTYSLMLRLGMRLSKVEPELAKQWVQKAVAGGVIGDNSGNCYIKMTDKTGAIQGLVNGDSWALSDKAKADGKLSEAYINFLQKKGDPRLKYIAAIYTNPDDVGTIITDITKQKGLPNGYSRATIESHSSWDDLNEAGEHQYSAINRAVLGQFDGPMMFLTCAEMKFLMAEACVRQWIAGDAGQLYNEGVSAAMKNLSIYNSTAIVTDAEIKDYLDRNPFVGLSDTEKAIEQINTQFWGSILLNGYETFANWRRSGYPALTPVNYPGNETNGSIPRRCKYPEDELVYNADSYKAAVGRQGDDSFTTRVWWDKK